MRRLSNFSRAPESLFRFHFASVYGLVLALMFLVFQAPDVALSQIAVGAVVLPLMILLALAKIRRCKQGDESKD